MAEALEESLNTPKIEPEDKQYLRYRIACAWPNSDSGISDILRVEQSHHILDLYETFVHLLQLIAHQDALKHLSSLAGNSLTELSAIQDFRLSKLATWFGPGSEPAPPRSSSVSDLLFGGDLPGALRAFANCGYPAIADPWQAVYAGIALSGSRKGIGSRARSILGAYRLIASVLRRDADAVNSRQQLEKLSNNLSGLPVFAGLSSFSSAISDEAQTATFAIGAVSLNSAFLGIEDYDRPNVPPTEIPPSSSIATQVAWSPLLTGKISQGDPPTAKFAQAVFFRRRGDLPNAIKCLITLDRESRFEPLRNIAARFALDCQATLQNKGAVIELIAKETATNELSPQFLPISEALSSFTWADFKPFAKDLSVGIALEALLRVSEKDSVATMLRFAFSYQLRNSGHGRPSNFADHIAEYDRSQLVYYLRYVCVPSIMDMSPVFQSSREVLEERRTVCASLMALDPLRSSQYENEIFSITNQLVIAEGLRLVDSSRLHVDTAALSRWATRTLAEDYARCVDLLKAGVGEITQIEQAITDILNQLRDRQVFYTPNDQATSMLTEITTTLRDEFLANSDYGLDYFLSKRVRHQSFIGLIRGPLEFANLITARESEFGPYRRNDALLDRFTTLTPDERDGLSNVLSDFAAQFDQLLVDLKNNQLQIRSESHPEGLFEIPVTSRAILFFRSVLQAGLSFDQFLNATYLAFWGILEPSLESARTAISTTLKTQTTVLFDRLRQELKNRASHDPAFPAVSARMGDVSVEVQRDLDSAAAWFSRPEGQQALRQFTLRQSLDIAIQSALKSQRAFEPALKTEITGDTELSVQDLLLLTDAIFIVLDNVRKHSGLRQPPSVDVRCSIDASTEIIELDVQSKVATHCKTPEREESLRSLAEKVRSHSLGKGTKTEGGSGFLKLAAALQERANSSLEFGFTDSNEFRVVLRFGLTQPLQQLEAAA